MSYPLHFSINASYLKQAKIIYTLGTKQYELVQQFDIQVPTRLFTETPQPIMQLDVDLLTFNVSPASVKAFAAYIDFTDPLGLIHSPFIYNSLTPFIASDTTLNWSDTLTLQGLDIPLGLEFIPLKVNIHVAGDEALEADFKLKLALTKINVL
jgi:hypothetical protein